jgi:hypothetical protein
VRWCVFAACVFGLSSSGCFSPKVKPGGFSCSTSDSSPCPSGFYCVAGLCQDTPGGGGGVGGNGSADLAVAVSGDMSVTSRLRDMGSTSMPDMAQASIDDLSQPPDDMTTTCKSAGSLCSSSSSCCSGVCLIVCL